MNFSEYIFTKRFFSKEVSDDYSAMLGQFLELLYLFIDDWLGPRITCNIQTVTWNIHDLIRWSDLKLNNFSSQHHWPTREKLFIDESNHHLAKFWNKYKLNKHISQNHNFIHFFSCLIQCLNELFKRVINVCFTLLQ